MPGTGAAGVVRGPRVPRVAGPIVVARVAGPIGVARVASAVAAVAAATAAAATPTATPTATGSVEAEAVGAVGRVVPVLDETLVHVDFAPSAGVVAGSAKVPLRWLEQLRQEGGAEEEEEER